MTFFTYKFDNTFLWIEKITPFRQTFHLTDLNLSISTFLKKKYQVFIIFNWYLSNRYCISTCQPWFLINEQKGETSQRAHQVVLSRSYYSLLRHIWMTVCVTQRWCCSNALKTYGGGGWITVLLARDCSTQRCPLKRFNCINF